MWPDRVSNPGPLTYESGALPTALRGPARDKRNEGQENIIQRQMQKVGMRRIRFHKVG